MTRQPIFTPSALAFACAALLCNTSAMAQAEPPATGTLLQQLREQRALLDQQRQELERQRAQLEQQQKQLESLAAALEQRPAPAASGWNQGAAAATGAAAGASTASAAAAPPLGLPTLDEPRGLSWSGYADLNYQRYDFFQNAQATTSTKRAGADLSRFVLSPRFNFGNGWSFAGELEIEHGGTGSTVEFEAEEAGEYEYEIEKGGEVALEQLYLQYQYSPALRLRIGELVVPVGMINSYHQPSEYFTVQRPLAESVLLPSVWHETGVELSGTLGQARYQLQAVTALDSTGFSGYGFIKGGMQRKMEVRNAKALALVAHGEWGFMPGAVVGASFYTGDSAPNRPRQNLQVKANVNIGSLYGRYERGALTVRGSALVGTVQNSEWITRANYNTFNGGILGTSRTPVGKRAVAYSLEAGYNVFSLLDAAWAKGRLDLFGRYELYDTHAQTADNISRIARYRQKAVTVGLNYKPQPGVVLKADYQRRDNDGLTANRANYFGLAAGFEF